MQSWEFAHSLISSFRSNQMSNCKQFAQIAQDNWVTVSKSLRSLRGNERPWAYHSGGSRQMSGNGLNKYHLFVFIFEFIFLFTWTRGITEAGGVRRRDTDVPAPNILAHYWTKLWQGIYVCCLLLATVGSYKYWGCFLSHFIRKCNTTVSVRLGYCEARKKYMQCKKGTTGHVLIL